MDGIKSNEIISQDDAKNEFTCLIKYEWDEKLHHFFRNPDIMITLPIILERNSFRITYLSTADNTDTIIEQYKEEFGDQLKILNITHIPPNKNSLSKNFKKIVIF